MGCHFLLQCRKVKREVKSLSRVRLLATPRTAAYQAPPSMGFSRQEYWSGVPGSLKRLQLRCQPGLGLLWRLPHLVGRTQFLTGLVRGPPPVSCPRVAHILPEQASYNARKAPRMENQAFHDLISEVSAFHFCHILLIQTKLKRRQLHKGVDHREQESMGVILKTDYHNV